MIPDWLSTEKYVSLETYKKNGKPVRTPVWFVVTDEGVLIVTRDQTGKVKRLRGNCQVRIAACTIKGTITGEWVSGTAAILDGSRTEEAVRLREKRYGFRARVARFLSRGRGKPVALLVRLC